MDNSNIITKKLEGSRKCAQCVNIDCAATIIPRRLELLLDIDTELGKPSPKVKISKASENSFTVEGIKKIDSKYPADTFTFKIENINSEVPVHLVSFIGSTSQKLELSSFTNILKLVRSKLKETPEENKIIIEESSPRDGQNKQLAIFAV